MKIAADGRGNCCGLTSVEIAVEIAEDLHSNLPRIGGLPWQWPRMAADGRGNCCSLTSAEITVAIAADFRGLPWLVPRSLPRTDTRHVPWPQPCHLPWKRHKPWPLPWKPADFHGSPWQHPRKSTEVPRSLPRTSPKMSNNVHPSVPKTQRTTSFLADRSCVRQKKNNSTQSTRVSMLQ